MHLYDPLEQYLAAQPGPTCTMTFMQIQQLTGVALPRSAFLYSAWWANNGHRHTQAQAWFNAGWRVENVDVHRRTVTFVQ